MAVARQEQSNVMLYTVITFVGLFIVAAVLAVLFYIRSEDWRNQFLTSQQNHEGRGNRFSSQALYEEEATRCYYASYFKKQSSQ